MPQISEALQKTFTSKVGGLGGLGASEATSVITLEKLVFAPGEAIRVNIDHDNSSCKKAVKSFKIKLQRVINCMSGKKTQGKPLLTVQEYIDAKKYPGCAEKVRETRTIEFRIPSAEAKIGAMEQLHPELRNGLVHLRERRRDLHWHRYGCRPVSGYPELRYHS